MDLGFWEKLKRPIMALAPMADVTDAAFRRIIAKYGKPDVMFTEFVSADGLCHPIGRKKLLIDLSYTPAERPIVAQLFTGHPDKMYEAAKLVAELGFDGLDINMGCPDRTVEKQCAGAALMKNPKLAREIIRAARAGAGGALPISVKTRIGYNKNELEAWLPELLAEEVAAVMIHARTRKEMSDVPARWETVGEAVKLRDAFFSSPPARGGDKRGGGSKTLIFGNGDVCDLADAREKVALTGADGVMLGRAIFGNPWLFAESYSPFPKGSTRILMREGFKFSGLADSATSFRKGGIPIPERLQVMLEHTKLFEELFKGIKNFVVMKKHYKAYVQGFDGLPAAPGRAAQAGAKELRMKLMETGNATDVQKLVSNFLDR